MLDRVLSTCMDGRTVRINVMQPLTVNFVTDDQLSVEEKSSAVLARYKEVLLIKIDFHTIKKKYYVTFECQFCK